MVGWLVGWLARCGCLVGWLAVFTQMSSAQQDVGNHYVVPEVFWFKGPSSSMAWPRRPIPAEFRRGNDLRTDKQRGRKRKRKCCPACELLGLHKQGRRMLGPRAIAFCAPDPRVSLSQNTAEPENISRKMRRDTGSERIARRRQW